MKRKGDIERILFSRGQDNDFKSEELYAIFQDCNPIQIGEIYKSITDKKFHMMCIDERKKFIKSIIPYSYYNDIYINLLSDFRYGGYRILGDIICDLYESIKNDESKTRALNTRDENSLISSIIYRYKDNPENPYWKEEAGRCLYDYLRHNTDMLEAVKCAIALNKRNLMMEICPSYIYTLAARRRW